MLVLLEIGPWGLVINGWVVIAFSNESKIQIIA
jgi:hypothetical protein